MLKRLLEDGSLLLEPELRNKASAAATTQFLRGVQGETNLQFCIQH